MTGDEEQQLDQIIADFLQAQEEGQTVSEADIIAAHPELADELREFFDDLGQMDKLAGPLAAPVMSRRPVLGKLRYFGDYELLEEIARGGMGIVYKARQTSLNRIVAVKLILSGHLASEIDVKRFQTEAESAANLQHPHILSVHEVGRYEGQSYFSMDYIDGKNLSELVRDHPLPPKRAASYVRAVAEAIHYAHQQGTLHRDLKPSNVLIDQNDRVQITDFGLAFREESDSGLTRTGQVLGTPSYMPPEQAQHKRGLIGPASDIYSIGAVLYELLTGRPPFQSDSAIETLRQVIETEPLSPRLLNPAVPKDLETICLKCLQKEQHKRYATAQHLADDLGRFLQGEPILARPVGRAERAWRWCKRNRSLAGLGLALLVLSLFSSVQWYRADLLGRQLTKSNQDLNDRNRQLEESQEKIAGLLRSVQNWESRDALPPLLDALRHESPELRKWSATMLGLMGEKAKEAVPALTALVGDDEIEVCVASCSALGRIGPAASGAMPALKRVADDPGSSARDEALVALIWIEPDSDERIQEAVRIADQIVDRTNSSGNYRASPSYNREARLLFQELLREGVQADRRYLARVLNALEQETHHLKQLVLFEVARVGKTAVPALRTAAADENETTEVRRSALWSLAIIGPDAVSASPQIEDLLDNDDTRLHDLAKTALLRVAPERSAELGLKPYDPSDEIAQFNAARGNRERDWGQLGGSHSRNNAPAADDLPEDWNVNNQTNVKWKAELGSQSYGNLSISNGKIYVGTNNKRGYIPRYPPKVDLGVLLCVDEKDGHVLWQYSSPKLKTGRVHDWPQQGLCSTPYVEGDRMWFVTNRCEVVCLDTEGYYDGEDDGVSWDDNGVEAGWVRLFSMPRALHRNHEQLRTEFTKAGIELPKQFETPVFRSEESQEEIWMIKQKQRSNYRQTTKSQSDSVYLYALKIRDGVLRAYPVNEGGETDYDKELFRAPDRLLQSLEAGRLDPLLATTLESAGVTLSPDMVLQAEADQSSWTCQGTLFGVERTFRLGIDSGILVCEYFLDSPDCSEADVVWKFDMMDKLGVSPHNMSTCAPTAWGDVLFICTSNGLDETHINLPAPDAPSFIAMNKDTAEVLWKDNSPGMNILHGQWSCPTVGVFNGVPQVIFPGGDGWLYSFHAERWQDGKPELLWKFDGNPKASKWILGGQGTRNNIIGPPVIYDGLLYFAMGQDPEHGEGYGIVWCIDPAKRGDVSATLVVDQAGNRVPHRRLQALDESKGEREIPNPNSAVVWSFQTQDVNADGEIQFEEEMHRVIASPTICDDLLIAADIAGAVYCIDAKTGNLFWAYDQLAQTWGSPLIADGKIYVGDEDGDLTIFRLSRQKEIINEIYMEESHKMMPVAANDVLYIATLSKLYAIVKNASPPGSTTDAE